MYYKSWVPVSIFTSVVGLPFYCFSNSLDTTVLDSSFFQDPNLFNKLENEDFVYKSSIEEDSTGIKNYFFNNSFSLLWKKKNGVNDDEVFGNAFLINIMYPPHLGKDDPSRYTYTPKYYQPGEEIILLVGTSFSFVSKVFKGLNEWDKVNDCTKVITLDKHSGNGGNGTCPKEVINSNNEQYEFYFSHPYPEDNEKTGVKQQENLYSIKEDYLSKQEFQLNKPHFVKIENKNVGLVYAAVDLKVNKKLINIALNSREGINNVLRDVHTNTKDDSDFQSEMRTNWFGTSYKFAADFAVLQLKVQMKDIRGLFRDYLRDLFKKEGKITKIPRNSMSIRDGKTEPLYLAGWSVMSQTERDQHEVDNLLVEAKAKAKNGVNNGQCNSTSSSYSLNANNDALIQIVPSDIKKKHKATSNSLGDCLELVLKNSSSQSSQDKYVATDFEYFPNDEYGFLYVDYYVQNKNTKKKFPKKRTVIFDGFKKRNPTARRDFVNTYNDTHRRKSDATKRFLEADPKGMAEWKELSVQYGYFPIQNIHDKVHKLNKEIKEIDTTTPLETFQAGGSTYVNISHQVNIPNLGLSQAKGIMALMKDQDSDQNIMVGMYEGRHAWTNPIGLDTKAVGKVMLFISPWRYDLFNSNNKLSRPSLGDSLKKKKVNGTHDYNNNNNMKDYLIYGNVFNLGS
ncbi:hypothetical protein A6V39_02680 [Candidatus Mycoplasma haematobovis]|uniref:Uncharacterized protein n=1 Tax=Candidatus Mycoplasma haematobovis TaxID=432608 RepID=A0A1A9QE90_9MOLU|nr:hypothetical protein [Candidatus Mycoplasma haematobovis]OAL10321.1 hypothetical protein A6V39_02680 [Candidatus Mycoplasma haematobovis]